MTPKPGVPPDFADSAYRRRRFQNWMLVGLLYSFFYMTRYNFSALSPTLKDVFGWTKSDLGIFETLLPLVYGLSVVLNAPLADRFGGRRSFLFGAVGVVVMNVTFGLFYLVVVSPGHYRWDVTPRELAWIMAVVWAVNGYFQSFGALSIVKINAQWFHVRERGTFAAIFGVLIRFGLILAFSGVPIIAAILPWQYAFFIPAALVFVLFLGTLLFVAETPVAAGFSERDTGDVDQGTRPSVLFVVRRVFTSRTMWMIALASMMIGFVRRSVVDAWWPVYYKEVLGSAQTTAGYQVTAWGIAIAGIIGGFAFGMTSDRVFEGRRAPVISMGFLGMALALGVFALAGQLRLGVPGATASMLLLSFFVNGAHGMIGGAASMDFGGRRGAATAAGLFDGMQYLAGAVTGTAVGAITTRYGWEIWKLWPIPFALIGAAVMARLWNVTPSGRPH
jgi:OPA family glycerol-3-phosphate transporter-like MFS transporter